MSSTSTASGWKEHLPRTILKVHTDDDVLYFPIQLTLEDREVQTTADRMRNYEPSSGRVWTAKINAARAKTGRKHDDDNPTLARGLSMDPIR